MIGVGERSGSLREMLDEVSTFYDSESEVKLEQLTTTIEPAILVVMGGVVVTILLSIYLAYSLVSGHARRDLAPSAAELSPRHIGHEILDHARLRFPEGEAARRYNTLQKLAKCFTDGPLKGRRVDVESVEGRPPKTIDVAEDDGGMCRYCLAEWTQSGDSAAYTFLYRL